MRPVYDTISHKDLAFAFCLKFFAITRTPQQQGIVLLRNGDVQAACVYDWFNGSTLFMHCAAKPGRKWLNRDFLHWAFDYPFNQLHVSAVRLWVDANNADSLRFVTHLGFTKEATLAGAGQEGVDAHIYVMKREDCRYANPSVRQPREGQLPG